MKTILFFILLTITTLFSCTNDDDNNTNQNSLTVPELLTPNLGATYGEGLQELFFDWSDVANSINYKITIISVFNQNTVFEETVTQSSISVDKSYFLDNETYTWKVTVFNQQNMSKESELRIFTYEFGGLQLISPSNNTVYPNGTTTVTLQCEDVSSVGITGYRFTVYRDGGFLVTQQFVPNPTFTLQNLSNNTIYTWDVTATKSSGGLIPSNTWSFSTQ